MLKLLDPRKYFDHYLDFWADDFVRLDPWRDIVINGKRHQAHCHPWSRALWPKLLAVTLAFSQGGSENDFVTESLVTLVPTLPREEADSLPIEIGWQVLEDLGFARRGQDGPRLTVEV